MISLAVLLLISDEKGFQLSSKTKAMIVIAPPGGGKTELSRLAEAAGFIPVRSKQILKAYVANHNDGLASMIRRCFANRNYVSDRSMAELFQAHMLTHHHPSNAVESRFFIEGIPRTLNQLYSLIDFLGKYYDIHRRISALYVKVDRDLAIRRQLMRTEERDDKDPAVIREGIEIYEKTSPPILARLRRYNPRGFYELNNNGSIEELKFGFLNILRQEDERQSVIDQEEAEEFRSSTQKWKDRPSKLAGPLELAQS